MVKKIKKRRRGKPPRPGTAPGALPSASLPDRRGELSISLCMIVKNESRLIAECLRRARSIASQLVVVDTGSEDDTAALAAAEGAEVYHHPWPGHFSAARNLSLQYARNDWVLILDGDELLDPATLAALTPAHLARPEVEAWEFVVVNFSTDRPNLDDAHYQSQIRLFRNRPEHRYQGLDHNQLLNVETGAPLPAAKVAVRVLHYGYIPAVWAAQRKVERLTMLEAALAEEPDSPFCHFNLANHLKILEDHEPALEHFLASLDADLDTEWVQMAYLGAAFCASQVGRHELAVDVCDRLLARVPFLADAWLRRSEALLELGRRDELVATVAPLLEDERLWFYKRWSVTFGLPYRLGRALFELGRHAEAIPLFAQLAERSEDPTVFTHLCLCALYVRDLELAREAYRRGIAIAPTDPDWPVLRKAMESLGLTV